ncbi:MAG: hypothetical protein JWN76_699 [Chitinophagaceae bacterium]|nr:hypothetical protein [Chitinophagaceae bacterium]
MNRKTSDRAILGYITALVLFIITFFFTFYQTGELLRYTKELQESNFTINHLTQLLINGKHLENEFRHDVLKKEDRRQYFANANSVMNAEINHLNQLDHSAVMHSYLDSIKERVAFFHSHAVGFLKYYKSTGYTLTDSAQTELFNMMLVMEKVTGNISAILAFEKNQLENHYEHLSNTTRTVKYINILLLVLAIAMIVYSLLTYSSEHKGKTKADEQNKVYAEELERQVEELAKTNKELSELRSMEKFTATGRIARTIAHEVRNPLTNINLAADQMRNLAAENSDSEILVNMIMRNSTRINQLVSDLLNSTKFLELHYQNESVHKVLDATLEMAADRIELQNIKVEKTYSDDCEVMMDIEKIKIAFLNIIVNAIEAMESGKGILKIHTTSTASSCIVTIADNGTGMDQESINKLFEPYFTSKSKGSGLGLTNTHNIIYTHKGTIDVESTKGVGTTFIVSLKKQLD